MSWQHIDSAPKDGSRILSTDGDNIFIVRWTDMNKHSTYATYMTWCVAESDPDPIRSQLQSFKPIGWMSLPDSYFKCYVD